jgi:hypothetical protein
MRPGEHSILGQAGNFQLPDSMTPKMEAKNALGSASQRCGDFVLHLSDIHRPIAKRTGIPRAQACPDGLWNFSRQQFQANTFQSPPF